MTSFNITANPGKVSKIIQHFEGMKSCLDINYIYLVALAKINIFYIFFKMAQFLVRSTRLTHGHPMVFPLFPRQHGEVTAFLNPDGQVAVVVRNLGFQNNSAEAARNRRNHSPSKEFCLWISGCVSV